MNKISVIVPCYNVAQYLDRCVNSLVEQTTNNLEIILVDDRSTDDTPRKCDEWAQKDSRIKVVHKPQNEGLGFARNTGLEHATGDYVAFVDSDDFVSTRMYETLIKKAIATNSDAIYCNCISYKSSDNYKVRYDVKEECTFVNEQVKYFLLDIIGPVPEYPHDVKYMASVWHALFKKAIFDKHNIRFVSERQFISEDLIFDIDFLSQCNSVVYIPEALYYYCDNGMSLSRKVDTTRYKRNKDILVEIEKRLKQIFSYEDYNLHFKRQQIHRLIMSIKQAVKIKEAGMTIQSVLSDSFWSDLLQTYPFYKMNLRHRMYFYAIKHRYLWWILRLYVKKTAS